MKKNDISPLNAERHGERGAALITMLLISSLLLVAGGALILTTGATNTTAIDATSETQAYYAAEAGLQDALSVLRGNVQVRAGMALPVNTKIRANFRTANVLATSNTANDAANNPDGNAGTADGFARLSGWLPYNNTTIDARVPVPGTLPGQTMSYTLNITDPDDPNRVQLNNAALVPPYQPTRLLVQVTGFGPRGARKFMELMVSRIAFEYNAPSTLAMVGPIGSFAIGSSNAKGYTGVDQATGAASTIPMFGLTDSAGQTNIDDTVFNCGSSACNKAKSSTSDPETSGLATSNLPPWLRSPSDARAFLNDLEATAESMGRRFTSSTSDIGTSAAPKFTFINGSASLAGSGAGLVVVTGNVTFDGNFSFDGLLLVLGSVEDAGGNIIAGGSVVRNGGGNGTIAGALIVSKFDRNDPNGPFLPTTFDTNGGGNSDIEFNSVKVAEALNTLVARVHGVREL